MNNKELKQEYKHMKMILNNCAVFVKDICYFEQLETEMIKRGLI